MNSSELRTASGALAEEARSRLGARKPPSASQKARAAELFKAGMEFISDCSLSPCVKLRNKYRQEPDWTWQNIAEFSSGLLEALIDRDNKLAGPLAEERLRGI